MSPEIINLIKELAPIIQTAPGVAILGFILYIWAKHFSQKIDTVKTLDHSNCTLHALLDQKITDIKESMQFITESQKEMRDMFNELFDRMRETEKQVYGLKVVTKYPGKVDDDTKG